MYRPSFRTFPSFLNPRVHSAHNTWATLWNFHSFSSKTQSSFILSTTTEQWKFLYRILTYILLEWIPINFDFTVHSQFKSQCPKSHKIVYFLSKRFITKKLIPGNRIGVACTGRLICAFVVHIWQNRFSHDVTHFQIDRSYLCRNRRKEFVASNFTVKKKKKKKTVDLP